jgi:hypothetical protein
LLFQAKKLSRPLILYRTKNIKENKVKPAHISEAAVASFDLLNFVFDQLHADFVG